MATPIDFLCPRCHADEGERCRTLTDGTDRTTPHDARRRKAGQRVERPEPTAKQTAAREAGWRHFVVAGAFSTLRNVARCAPVVGFDAEDEEDVVLAVEALGRIDERRKVRAREKARAREYAGRLEWSKERDVDEGGGFGG